MAVAVLALLPLVAVCVDGVAPPVPQDRVERLSLAPVYASTVSAAGARPINAIRITALLVPGGEVLTRETFPVDPDRSEWTLELAIPISAGLGTPDFHVLMELMNVADGVESVEWSGRSRTLKLDLLSQIEIHSVEVFRGPPANLDVGSVAIEPHDSVFEEGATTTLEATVAPEAQASGAVVFWESDDPAVATVAGSGPLQGQVTFTGPGTATITAEAGAARDHTVFRAVQRPDSVAFLPEGGITLESLEATARLRAVLLDPRGDSIPGESFTWSVLDGGVVRHLGDGVFQALAPGTATVTAHSDRNPDLSGTTSLTVAQVASRVEARPPEVYLGTSGEEVQLSVTARDANGFPVEGGSYGFRSTDPDVASVSASGLVTAVASGLARVVVAAGSAADTVDVTVGEALAAIQVTPATHRFTRAGDTLRYQAVAVGPDGGVIPTLTRFEWSVDDLSVAVVDGEGLVTAVGDGVTTVSAEVGEVRGSGEAEVFRVVDTVQVTPAADTLEALGATLRLVAQGRDAAGDLLEGRSATWVSLDPEVATVDENGVVTAVANGEATVQARMGEVGGAARVTVAQAVDRIEVTPPSYTFSTLGATRRFQAEAFDGGGSAIPGQGGFLWRSSDPTVVVVDATGLATSRAVGAGRITASVDGVEASAEVTVEPAATVAEVVVSPASGTFTSRGEVQAFTAVALDADGDTVPDVGDFTWTSTDSTVVTVDADGTVTAVAPGSAQVRSEVHEVFGSATVTVTVPLDRIEISPDGHTFTAAGETLSLDALAFDADGFTMPQVTDFYWSSSAVSVVRVAQDGTAEAVDDGAAVVTAAHSGIQGSVELTVVRVAASVTIEPAAPATLTAFGQTTTLQARVEDGSGEIMLVPATWSTLDPDVVTVSETGVVTAVGDGTGRVVAAREAVADTVTVTVAQETSFISVSPRDWTSNAAGQTRTFTAQAFDAGGSLVPGVTSFAWASSDPLVASVSPAEGGSTVVTSEADGTVEVTAAAAGLVASAPVRVSSTVASVTITPSSPAVLTSIGDTRALSASTRDILGNRLVRSVAWSSLDDSVATVDADGVVTAADNGTAGIVATSEGKADTVTVEVDQAVGFVTVTPETHSFSVMGDTEPFQAQAFDPGGTPVTPIPEITWASSDPAVATVDADGVVTAVADGSTVVTAEAAGKVGTASVTVGIVVAGASVSISPTPPPTLTFIGATTLLTGTVEDGAGNPVPDATVTWSSLDPAVATVDGSGLVTASRNGAARIQARHEGDAGAVADTVTVTVAQEVSALTVSPASVAMAPGDPDVQLSADAVDAGGTAVTPAPIFTWISNDPVVATVTPDGGLLTAVADGSTTVDATADGVTGSASVLVTSDAVARTFTGAASDDLLDPANWEPSGVPGDDDTLVLSAGTTATLSSDFTLGSLVLEDGATLEVTEGSTLELIGDLDATGAVTGTGTVEMSGTDATISGTVPNLDVTGTVTVSGEVTVDGDLETADGGILSMTDPDAELTVEGDLLLGGGDTAGELTDGTIYLSGELINVTTSFKTFNPDGAHTVVFDGTVEQSVFLEFPGKNQHRFQNVVVDNPAGVRFLTSIPILGDATIRQGSLGAADTIRTDVGGDIADDVGGGWRMPTTVVSGAAPTLPATLATDLEIPGATLLQNSLAVDGDVSVTGSSSNLDLNGHDLTVTGAFGVEDSGLLTMADPASDLTVQGDVSFGGRSSVGALTAGRILASSDFHWVGVKVEPFAPSGSHQVVFNGTGVQEIVFSPGGNRAYAFQDLRIAAGADVTPAGSLTVKGDMVLEGTFTIPTATTLTILGTLTGDGTLVELGGLEGG